MPKLQRTWENVMAAKLKKAIAVYELKGVHVAAAAFPMMGEEEYSGFLDDVKKNGFVTDAIVDSDGYLLDGRNRLCASIDADVDISIETKTFESETKKLDYIISLNLMRRHLSLSQKAMVGETYVPLYAAAAKERQREGQSLGGKTAGKGRPKLTSGQKAMIAESIRVDLPGTYERRARDDAAKAVGVSGSLVGKAQRIVKADTNLAEQVRAGKITINDAEKQIRQRENQAKKLDPQQKVSSNGFTDVVQLSGKPAKIPMPKKVVFNHTNEHVDWAGWTWNPVTGCDHGCSFCYARAISCTASMAPYYPHGFKPSFHEYRLAAPKNTKVPDDKNPSSKRVFVCSMADLFGKWVPMAWIKAVFDSCLNSPEWQYIFLTKWPAKYKQLPLIPRAWYGASVTCQGDVSRVENAMKALDGSDIRWVNVEPMLTPVLFNDLSWCSMVAIGSQRATHQPDGDVEAISPHFDWVVDLVNQCREAEVPYYLKSNLGLVPPGMVLPKSVPTK